MRSTAMAMAVGAGILSNVGVARSVQAEEFRTVFNFTEPRHGAEEFGENLTGFRGRLFGVTYLHRDVGCNSIFGTVFSINPQFNRRQLKHCFQGGFTGDVPEPGFVVIGDLLYGGIKEGGPGGNGAIYSLDPKTDAFKFVYSFDQSVGGSNGSLIASGSTIYGSTSGGNTVSGDYNAGSVFSFNVATGVQHTLYTFYNHDGNGAHPLPGLIYENAILYGSTLYGGTMEKGIVFSVDPATNAEKILHSFGSGDDGSTPTGPLTKVGNKLYGTTITGGSSNNGTIFTIDLVTGKEEVVHSFGGGTDGVFPEGGLTYVHGKLYGTTAVGGSGTCLGYGCGTIFALDLASMTESAVYSFPNSSDGNHPYTTLTDVRGTLYGTTYFGGAGGAGIIFAFTP